MFLLAAENVTKSYYKKNLQIPVLKGVNFGVCEGEFVSIVGQSGSGKSTLLHLLGTLDKPDNGIIRFDGNRIDNLLAKRRDTLRNRSIGFVFQFYHLLPELTVLENVLSPLMIRHSVLGYWFSRKHYHAKTQHLLEQVGLQHRLKHKPSELSGGEMQRTAIARALVMEPKILLADEPTGNLDAVSAQEVIALLRHLCTQNRLSVVMVTHDSNIAAVADRSVKMIDGQIF
ncbi:MAG: ABC transporter ATP-binding protein [Planctomycetaceae bacterium]|jgi:lipoprotein-releasing system ATP-binding protein|nr:ABC transporter ATP-binding protein [Planctomycetaceae bacterium]